MFGSLMTRLRSAWSSSASPGSAGPSPALSRALRRKRARRQVLTWAGVPVDVMSREALIEAVYDLAARLEVVHTQLHQVEIVVADWLQPESES